jgi:hypothetical protein
MEPYDNSMPEMLKQNGIYSHLISDHYHYWEDGGCTYHTRYSSWECSRGQEGDPWKVYPELIEQLRGKQDIVYHEKKEFQDQSNRKYITSEERMPQATTFRHGLEFLSRNVAEDNWFLQIETFDPHEPFFTQEAYRKAFEIKPDAAVSDWPPYYFVTEDADTVTQVRNYYAALITMCDTYLGKVLDFMDAHDMWKDTLLIVNTDHGYLLGEHGWWAKGRMPVYDELARTPLFIYDPRFKLKGQHRSALTQTIDLPATILDFFGIALPKEMDGKSLVPVIKEDSSVHDYILYGYHGKQINITDGRYTYMHAPERDCNFYEYTLMPTHMRNFFSTDELQEIELAKPFTFTKGCKTMKVKGIDGPVDSTNYGDLLFDTETDPGQLSPIDDPELETRLLNEMSKKLYEADAPEELYGRYGLQKDGQMTVGKLRALKEEIKFSGIEQELVHAYSWTQEAINMYCCLKRLLKDGGKQLPALLKKTFPVSTHLTYEDLLQLTELSVDPGHLKNVKRAVILNSRYK